MPALSPTMTEGNIASWIKKEGDKISTGDLLCEIETDKATMEIEAINDGILGKIIAPDGTENVPVNAVIGIILEVGEGVSVLDDTATETIQKTDDIVDKVAGTEEYNEKLNDDNDGKVITKNVDSFSTKPTTQINKSRIFSSPLARRMASQAGLDLTTIEGSGPKGRIVKVDIEEALKVRATGSNEEKTLTGQPPVSTQKPPKAISTYEEIKTTNIRKVIADRLQTAKQTIPHFYLNIDCKVDAVFEVRENLNSRDSAYKISLNDFIISASALALKQMPECNASWMEENIRFYSSVDISIAVAIEEGLVTPIIRNADKKGLAAISKESRELADRARSKPMSLKPEEYQGGTFSISNLGMFGIKEFSAIINPPQAMILAIGVAEARPIVNDNALSIGKVMSCTLSVDHRVVDGATAAKFLQVFKGLIEDPLTMLL